MYRILFFIIAGIIALITLCIGIFQPKMHKPLMLYNSDYEIVIEKPDVKPVKNIPTQVNQPNTIKKVQKIETYTQKTPETTEQKTATTISTNKQNPLLNLIKQETTTSTVTQNKKNTQELQPASKTVTEEEKAQREVILWNEWRSNLQNQIMNDVRLPIMPEGTIFKFSFNVDKYGKISNVQTWSLSPAYTPYAIQYIAPVIRSYQGHDILKFPQGSNRFETLVEGGWKISKTTKYSTPDDFSDTEKILNRN